MSDLENVIGEAKVESLNLGSHRIDSYLSDDGIKAIATAVRKYYRERVSEQVVLDLLRDIHSKETHLHIYSTLKQAAQSIAKLLEEI